MGLARYVVDAVLIEGRSAREVAAAHAISKSWIYELIKRFRAGGYEALNRAPDGRAPAAIRPRPRPSGDSRVSAAARRARTRRRPSDDRLPPTKTAGRGAIAQHDLADPQERGLIVPQPQKRPRSSLIRFQAELPNEMWQTDITHWQLSDHSHAEILNIIDDHSRLLLHAHAYPTVKALDVVASFHNAAGLHGLPASLLSDNGAVFTATPRKGKVLLQTSSSGSPSSSRTAAPTTHKPAARSSAYTKPSSATSTSNTPPKRSQNSKSNSTPSGTTTTTSGPTEPSADEPPCRPTAPASKPNPQPLPPPPTTACAKTRSTPTARSASAT